MSTQKSIKKKRYKAEEIERYLKDWKESGKSQIAFSKERGINYYTLNKWINERKVSIAKPGATQAGFRELAHGQFTSSGLFAEIKREGFTIMLHQPVTSDYIRSLIK